VIFAITAADERVALRNQAEEAVGPTKALDKVIGELAMSGYIERPDYPWIE